MSETIKEYQKIAQMIGKFYRYQNANLSFVKTRTGEINENVVLISLTNPKESSFPNEISASFLNTGDGIRVINFFMSKFYLFDAAEEERAMFPVGYKLYQDDMFAYITSDMPQDVNLIAKLFKVFNSFESIFLSEKTHCKYEKLSDYIENYEVTGEAINECIRLNEEKAIIEHLQKEYSYQKQIIEPLTNACKILLGKTNSCYTSSKTPYGEYVVMRFSCPGESFETGICLLISEVENKVSIKKIVGRRPEGGYDTIDLPNNVSEMLSLMQTKAKTSAAKA